MPLLPVPAFELIIAGYGLQVTEVLTTFGTVHTQEIFLQMRKFFLHLMRVLKNTCPPQS